MLSLISVENNGMQLSVKPSDSANYILEPNDRDWQADLTVRRLQRWPGNTRSRIKHGEGSACTPAESRVWCLGYFSPVAIDAN
jgi:hypothetical protein